MHTEVVVPYKNLYWIQLYIERKDRRDVGIPPYKDCNRSYVRRIGNNIECDLQDYSRVHRPEYMPKIPVVNQRNARKRNGTQIVVPSEYFTQKKSAYRGTHSDF